MNKDIMQGKWRELKGRAKEQWGQLTDDDLEKVEGRSDRLIGLLQQRYGYAKEKAEHRLCLKEDSGQGGLSHDQISDRTHLRSRIAIAHAPGCRRAATWLRDAFA